MKLRDAMPELHGAAQWLNKEVTRAELVGEKPALIHFWSISCHLCKEDMNRLNELRDKYEDKLNICAVHKPRSKADHNIEDVKKAAADYGITQPIYIDSRLILADAFENRYLPAYYVFDKEGKLRHFQAGGTGLNMLETRVNKIVEETRKTN